MLGERDCLPRRLSTRTSSQITARSPIIKTRVANLALKEPNFSILASFDTVWLRKICFGFSLFFGFFLASF
jgi:hypothetical protein